MNSSIKLINVGSRQLQAFLEICKCGSFAAAAERVHLSPSGVSMLVKELERQLGVRLFERTTRAVALTDAGRVLRPYAEKVVAELRELGVALQGSSSAVRPTLTIAATPVIATCLLPKVVADFARKHPDVRIQVMDGSLETVRQAVLDGQANMGIAFFVKPAAGILREPVCKFRLMSISPGSKRQNKRVQSRSWKSLDGLPMIALPIQNPIQALIDAHLPNAKASQEERAEMNFLGTMIAMVEAGLGNAVVPSFMMEECQQHGVQIAMLTDPPVHLNMYVALRRGTERQMAETQFIEGLKAQIESAKIS
ncbi:MAG: LysR family transcriptional regulator [Comamonas sp.]|uniref:LysR family transcriptional regulator n=1 Tax=Comamonas sp. TaxID=34028 RepID=UPI00283580E0|nr:LysR family transcriptional regulator [Comamonas sp.]MDR0216001.1 LysR family transcriptional regulator [Comamonas sp.]